MKGLDSGLIAIDHQYSPVTTPIDEGGSFLKRLFFDTLGIALLTVSLPWVWILNRIVPTRQKRIMVGTHPIVSNIHYKALLKQALGSYAIEMFIFRDWLNEPSYYDMDAYSVLPRWIVGNDPYAISPYFIFIWAMRRYRGFYWHLDGAILERTLIWKMEPLLLQIFGKKVIMQGYGSDQWSLLQSTYDLNFKLGLSYFRKRYFMMDFKRIERNYMWAKYVDGMIGDFRYLPRVSGISMAHYYIELEELPYRLNENTDTIIIAHFANHPERKGSHAIQAVCEELIHEGYPIEYRSVHGVSRAEALAILEEAHIFIEHLFNGTFGTAALEAMAKGNVVLTNFDQRIVDVCLVQNYRFYGPFFRDLPIVATDIHRLKAQIIQLVENPVELRNRIEASRQFVEESTRKVVEGFVSDDEHGLKALFERGK